MGTVFLFLQMSLAFLSTDSAFATHLNTCTLVEPELPAQLNALEAYAESVLRNPQATYRACTQGTDIQSPLRGASFAELARKMDVAALAARTLLLENGKASSIENPLTKAMLASENLTPSTLNDRRPLLQWSQKTLPRLSEGLAHLCVELRTGYAQNDPAALARARTYASKLSEFLHTARTELERTLASMPESQHASIQKQCSDEDDQSLLIGQVSAEDSSASVVAHNLTVLGANLREPATEATATNAHAAGKNSEFIPLN